MRPLKRWVVLAAAVAVAVAVALVWRQRAPASAPARQAAREHVRLTAPPAAPPPATGPTLPEWLAGPDRWRRIAGRVTADGAPAAGATVRLACRASELAGAPVLAVETGRDGRFDFGGQRATACTLAAAAAGRTQVVRALELDDPALAADALELALEPCRITVEGEVRAAGKPLAGARVRRPEKASIAAVTDAAGRYRLCVGAADEVLVVEADGLGLAPPSETSTTTFAPARTIAGRCHTEDGEPVAGAVVALGEPPRTVYVLTDAADEFSATVQRVEGLRIIAFSEDRRGSGYAARGEVDLSLGRTGRIAGKVVAAGHPLAGVRVSFDHHYADEATWPAYSQLDGSFVLERAFVGPQLLETRGFAVLSPTVVQVEPPPADTTVVLEVAALGKIHGRVTRDGRAAAAAEVSCKGAKELPSGPVRAGPDGDYACPGMLPGRHPIIAEDEDGAFSDEIDIDLALGEDRRLDLELAHSASAAGVLVDEAGRPIAGASVKLTAGSDEGEATTDDAGRFRVEALAGGTTYRVTLWPDRSRARPFASAQPPTVSVPGFRSHVEGLRLEGRP